MLTLRPYEPADAKIILSWIRSREDAIRWSVDRYDRYPILPEDMNHKYLDCHGDCPGPEWFFPVTAMDGDKVAGHLILRYPDADKRTVRLGFVIVDRDCRRKGYGKAMLKLALGFAFRELKAEKVTLGVLANNPDAYHCYRAVGFEDVTAEVPEYYDFLGEQVKCLELEMEMKPDLKFNIHEFAWTREPESYTVSDDRVEIITKPHTDLWQRTYYHFRNDNAPVLQMETEERYFSFTVKTEFESHHRFDQCGVVLYLDSENWLKGSIEYENEQFQHLGSVVTNLGYSDWATTEISAESKSMWYRLSRREDDYRIECSLDGVHFAQMRICHLHKGGGAIRFGIYACSPENSSFKATFTNMSLTECKWLAHDGQQPD